MPVCIPMESFVVMEFFMVVVVDIGGVIYAWDSSMDFVHPINPVWKSRISVCRFRE